MNKHSIKTEGVREQCVLTSDAISSTIRTLLGPGRTFKCFIDEDGSGEITSSALHILEHLDVEENPVGKAYKQCCDGYVVYVGESGLSTLITLAGLLVKKGNELESLGVPLINVMAGFREAVNVCSSVLETIAIQFSAIVAHATKLNNTNIQVDSKLQLKSDNSSMLMGSVSYINGNGSDEDPRSVLEHHTNSQLVGDSKSDDLHIDNNSGKTTQLAQMLANLGVTMPSNFAELTNADDVSWFFGDDEVVNEETHLHQTSACGSTSDGQADNTTDQSTTVYNPIIKAREVDWLDIMGQRLSHGNDDMMELAVEVARLLNVDEGDWNLQRVAVRKLEFEHASIVDGLFIPLPRDSPLVTCPCTFSPNPEDSSLGIDSPGRSWLGRVCVVDGSAGNVSVVEGMDREVSVEDWYSEVMSASSIDESYDQQVRDLLEKHDVKLVVLSGDIQQSLLSTLHTAGIHVIPNIQGVDWDYFCSLTGQCPLGDITDVEDDFLSPVLRIEKLNIGGRWQETKQKRFHPGACEFRSKHFLRITRPAKVPDNRPPNTQFPVSVIIGGVTLSLRDDKERGFWKCLHRLRNSFQQNKVLPGGGFSEAKCILALEEREKEMMAEGSKTKSHLPGGTSYLALEAQAVQGFQLCLEEYLSIFAQNIGIPPMEAIDTIIRLKTVVAQMSRTNPHIQLPTEGKEGQEEHIYDDFVAKIEGYQRAVDTACVILSIRAIIFSNQIVNKAN